MMKCRTEWKDNDQRRIARATFSKKVRYDDLFTLRLFISKILD